MAMRFLDAHDHENAKRECVAYLEWVGTITSRLHHAMMQFVEAVHKLAVPRTHGSSAGSL